MTGDAGLNQRPSATVATRRIDAGDDLAIRLKASRAIVREAARRVAAIAMGCHVEGVEEVEFSDRLENALHDYIASRADPSRRREYVGNTRGMDQIIADLARIPAARTETGEEPAGSGEEGRDDAR